MYCGAPVDVGKALEEVGHLYLGGAVSLEAVGLAAAVAKLAGTIVDG